MGSRDEGQAAGLSAGRARRPHVRPEPMRESVVSTRAFARSPGARRPPDEGRPALLSEINK